MSGIVTATFVFTDLVDSTAIASSLGREAADELRSTHFELLRGAIDAAGGIEVKNLGDGLMVTFTSATRALAGAVAMQQAIERHNRRAGTPLAIRIGLAMGEATEEGGDYFGDPVIEAARLCAAATGGQILATELVASVVGRHAEQELVPVGDLELKGLPAPVPAVSVRWEPETVDGDAAQMPLPPQLVSVGNESVFAFFGRSAELGTIEAAVKSAASDHRLRAALIGGEPGMGKTSLAAHAARAAHRGGASVLFGGCAEGLCPPYGPWIGALTHLLTSRSPESIGALRGVHATALRRLLPAVADRLPTGDPVETDPDSERFLRMEAVVALLAATSADEPVVVVLDDVQWADDASLALLRHLVASPAPLGVVLIATYRSSDVVSSDPLGALLADAHSDPRVERIPLAGLSDAEIVELISAAAGYELDDEGIALAHALHRETDGNAFFVTEMLRHLSESGEIAPGEDGRFALVRGIDDLALPESVRDVVGQRVARLGDECARALATAAVIGPEFDVGLLGVVADLDDEPLLDLLDQATAAALIAESPDGGSFRFSHALVRHSLAQTLSATRRQRLHRRIAEALEELGTATTAELARHWIAATRPADTERARRYAEQAADEALAAVAPADAIRWYQQALDLLDQERDPDERERCRLLIALARAHGANGSPVDTRSAIERAGEIALRIDDAELIVEAGLGLFSGSNMFDVGTEQARAIVRRALEAVGQDDHGRRARLLATLAEASDAREWRARHDLAAQAVAAAERSSDPSIEIEIFQTTDAIRATPDRLAERLIGTRRALEARDLLASPLLRSSLYSPRAAALLESGDRAGFDECTRLVRVDADRFGLPMMRQQTGGLACLALILDGDADAAEAEAFESYELAAPVRHPTSEPLLGVQLLHVRRLQGRLDEIIEQFAAAAEIAEGMPVFNVTVALLSIEVGRIDDAQATFAALTAAGYDDIVPRDQLWLTAIVHCAEIAAALRDTDAARSLREQLAPYEDHLATTGMTFDGSVASALAPLDALLADPAEAERHFVLAIESLRNVGARFWLARTLLDHASFLQETNPSDTRAATERDEALEIAKAHGFAGLLPAA